MVINERKKLFTVNGPIDPGEAGITDGHNHVWIGHVAGLDSQTIILNDRSLIAVELTDYRQAGGSTIVDCQPGGCGRNGRVMRELAETSGVHIIACTGFHLRKYYTNDYWLFSATTEEANWYFKRELQQGLDEDQEVRAGFIKISCEGTLEKSPVHLMEAAVAASLETGAAIEVHTEKGADAELIAQALDDFGLTPDRLVLCHLDKRADFRFHSNMAQEGITLEYDTFFRPKYDPENNVWPLLERMVAEGYDSQLVVATDLAETHFWTRMGDGPGLTGLFTKIIPRLEAIGLERETILKLVGENIATVLARPFS